MGLEPGSSQILTEWTIECIYAVLLLSIFKAMELSRSQSTSPNAPWPNGYIGER
jgi:hypothetical protein